MLEFHVLFSCVYDAILGQDMLEETLAFELHQESFMEVEPDPSPQMIHPELNLVIWLPFRQAKRKASEAALVGDSTVLVGSAATSVHSELERRAAVESAIRRLPPGFERECAMREETEKRRHYEEGQRQQHRGLHPPVVSRRGSVNLRGMNLNSWGATDGLSLGASVAPWSRS